LADFELTSKVLAPGFAGWGVQFNQHVYAAYTGFAEEHLHELDEKVLALHPQLVRIFYNERQQGDPADPAQTAAQKDKWDSFVRTLRLAQRAGAAINVTWQSGPKSTPAERERSMARFAGVLDRLVTSGGAENLRWVTIQNEPNCPPPRGKPKDTTPERLADMYHRLDGRLSASGLREQIRFMGGDLLEGSRDRNSPLHHSRWFEHMSEHLADLIDAYSVHIYWHYFDTARFEHRLRDVRRIVDGLRNPRPLYVTEFGTRGRRPKGVIEPGEYRTGSTSAPIGQTNIAAFQHAWFQIRAAQLGYAGTVKWDCFAGKYDRTPQAFFTIGPPGPEGWPVFPTYYALKLFMLSVKPGWQIRGLTRRGGTTKQLAAFSSSAGGLAILGLDSRGSTANGRSTVRVPYEIGGLPPGLPLRLVIWNKGGRGRLAGEATITTDARGTAHVAAPLHSVFALTTEELPAELS